MKICQIHINEILQHDQQYFLSIIFNTYAGGGGVSAESQVRGRGRGVGISGRESRVRGLSGLCGKESF